MSSREVTMMCGAAVRLGDLGLLVGADGADHRDAERPRPLAGDQADAAGGRVVEDGLAALERIDLAEQVLRRHALHHQRRGGAVADTPSGSGISTSAGITRTSE